MLRKIKSSLVNLSPYSLRRFVIRMLLRSNGISNILFLFQKDKTPLIASNKYQCFIARGKDDLAKYKINERLKLSADKYFKTKKAACLCFVANNKVSSYAWFHYSFDANNELEGLMGKESYILIGPVFVSKKARGQGILREMVAIIEQETEASNLVCTISYDNVVSIRAFLKAGFSLIGVKYKLWSKALFLTIDNHKK